MSLSTPKTRRAKKVSVDRDAALLITSSVPVEKGFRFFMELDKPTGLFATSIFEFDDELKKVDSKSLEFHTRRKDFSKWLREVIRDDWLANQFESVSKAKLAGEKLRGKLVDLTDKRCKELADVLKDLVH